MDRPAVEGMWYVKLREVDAQVKEVLAALSQKRSVCFLDGKSLPVGHLVFLSPLAAAPGPSRMARAIRFLSLQDLLREAALGGAGVENGG